MRPLTIVGVESDLAAAIDSDDGPAIARLVDQLDRLDTHPEPVSCEQAALWYARHGLRVFPLQHRSKVPLPRCGDCKDIECHDVNRCGHALCHGCHGATTDLNLIRAWWTTHPLTNVAIATGHLVDVIDIDGLAGNVSLARELLDTPTLDDPYHGLPHVVGVVSTPRPGGRHLYVTAVEGRGNKAKILPGVDYRGAGGYVVAAPSVLDDRPGQYPGRYLWVRDLQVPT